MSDVSSGPPPLPAAPPLAVLPYATPLPPAFVGYAGAWRGREDGQLVVTKSVELPDRCVKCNAPGDGRRLRRTLYWHHPALYLVILAGVLIYAVVALVVRQQATVVVSLCPVHAAARRRGILVASLIALAGVGSICGAVVVFGDRNFSDYTPFLVTGGILLLLAGAIYGAVRTRLLSAARMQGPYAWLKGAGPEFLETFPPTGA